MPYKTGASLMEILKGTPAEVRTGCGGMGGCGLCKIKVYGGDAPNPTETERNRLMPEQIAAGIRLACQVRPEGTLCVTRQEVDPSWKILREEESSRSQAVDNEEISEYREQLKRHPLGVAVDLGTTQIKLTLWDLDRKVRLGGRSGCNPHGAAGSDVMTRLAAARESPRESRRLAMRTWDSIGTAICDMAQAAGYSVRDVGAVFVVGNTAVLSLLADKGYESLLNPDSWMEPVSVLPVPHPDGVAGWGVSPGTRVEFVAPVAGFVGSDLLCGLLATGFDRMEKGALFIDFGTNSEVALWDGKALLATSAAGGPAFEGCGISCGMPAESGAIFRAGMAGDTGEFRFDVIDGVAPLGICGTGLIDIAANLVRCGRLDAVGRLKDGTGTSGSGIWNGYRAITLTQRDVDLLQRAKAAIAAGVACLMLKSGLQSEDLRWIGIGGALGSSLNVENARGLGLIPGSAPAEVILCGNTALSGCEEVMLHRSVSQRLALLREKIRVVNMAQVPEFEHLFVRNLYLQPMTMR